MAAEIAVQQLLGISRRLEGEGTPLPGLLSAADVPSIDLSQPDHRLDWSHYAAVLDTVSRVRDDAWLHECGAASIAEPTARLFRMGLLIAFDEVGAALEWMVAPYGPFPAVTPCMNFSLQRPDSRTYLLRSSMHRDLAPCRAHHQFVKGVLAASPQIIFEEHAEVIIEPTDRGADYHIQPARRRRLAGLRRMLARRHARADYLHEVGLGYLTSIQQQIQLQAETSLRLDAEARLARHDRVESLGQIAASAAHDFNNLLMVAMVQVDRTRRASDEELAEHCNQTRSTLERAAALARRILAYAAQEPVTGRPLRLNDALSELQPLLESTLGSHIELLLCLSADVATATLDRDAFENAILNLAVNARDAMPESGRFVLSTSAIEVSDAPSLPSELSPGRYFRIRVRDTGRGFTEVALRRAFDPYYTTKAPGEGTGLGLSSVWGFARASGGYATLYNHPTGGAVVEIHLPEAEAQAETDSDAPPGIPDTSRSRATEQ